MLAVSDDVVILAYGIYLAYGLVLLGFAALVGREVYRETRAWWRARRPHSFGPGFRFDGTSWWRR